MRKRILLLMIFLLLSWGCAAGPPTLYPFAAVNWQTFDTCVSFEVPGSWQFVHIIEITPPGHRTITLMGVVQTDDAPWRIHCALLSLEGLVLFEARWEADETTVLRALPPLDKPGFADGLMADLLFIFMAPDIASQTFAQLKNGTPVCRYVLKNGEIRDFLTFPNGSWQLLRYAGGTRLAQTLTVGVPSETGDIITLPAHLSLKARNIWGDDLSLPVHRTLKTHGLLGYDLVLTLVSADEISP